MEKFFRYTTQETLDYFNTTTDGLTEKHVQENLQYYGENKLVAEKKKSTLAIFLSQFKDMLVAILIVAAIISMLSHNVGSSIVILVVLLLNAILGTVQYKKAEKSLDSLKQLSTPKAKVLRAQGKREVPSSQVVPGDILLVEAGDLLVADGRILSAHMLQVNESSLTGESVSVLKQQDTIFADALALGDQTNMVFSGSLVVNGRATLVVTATGMQTEIGKIAHLMNRTKNKLTPLQVSLNQFSKRLAFLILGVCALVFGLSLFHQLPLLDAFMFAVALAVAAIPEALSSIVTIVLAMGTQKMAKQQAVIKDLKAVESLGSVSIICTDKTGTLTQNKMTVQKIWLDNEVILEKDLTLTKPLHHFLLQCALLTNDSTTIGKEALGDPTELALVFLGDSRGIDEVSYRAQYPRISEIPFDSDRKCMSTLHEIGETTYLFTKGAIDVLLAKSNTMHTANGVVPMTAKQKEKILATNTQFSSDGLRVLAFAYKTMAPTNTLTLEDECDYTFLGLISMMDPPRIETMAAVQQARQAGIRPIMITGDHKLTATAIAKQLGILRGLDIALDGIELDQLTEEELDNRLALISVYSRVSPEHKIRIVAAWQRQGKIVAMTGDGVNDAPALKQADIGIAMGITGTDVSKDAAAMILMDDNFATIIGAVANGRNVYRNIKNAIKFLLSGNTSGILTVLYTSLLGLPLPFLPVHLLFMNLVTDSLPALAIGTESSNDNLLSEPPRDPKEPILTKSFLREVLFEGSLIGICTLVAYYMGLNTSPQLASTMAFATLTLGRLFHGFNCRSEQSIFRIKLSSNKNSIYAFLLGTLLTMLILFVPGLKSLFQIATLTLSNTLLIYALAFIPTCIIQLGKIVKTKERMPKQSS